MTIIPCQLYRDKYFISASETETFLEFFILVKRKQLMYLPLAKKQSLHLNYSHPNPINQVLL